MTDYGLKIKNTKLELQIDGAYRNYVLLDSVDNSALIYGFNDINLSVNTTSPPIILIRPVTTSLLMGVFDLNYTSPNYTGFTILCDVGGGNVDYRVYVATRENSTEGYGLRVKNPKGDMVYDTGYTPFKILDVTTITIGGTYTHASISDPFYLFSPWRARLWEQGAPGHPGPILRFCSGIQKNSATQVGFNWQLAGGLGITFQASDNNTGTTSTILVCDPNV